MSMDSSRNADGDVYRGDPPNHELGRTISLVPTISSTSDTSPSSSSSSSKGGRLGAIAAKLELAISRWARNVRGNSSNVSVSSSSSTSSIVTLTKSQLARKRRLSSSSLRTMQSERDISARILRRKALEQSRQIPREFSLYIPPSIVQADNPYSSKQTDEESESYPTWTTSLPLVLQRLDLAIRKSGRHRRPRPRNRSIAVPRNTFHHRGHDRSTTKRSKSLSPSRWTRKGKHRAMPDAKPHSTTQDKPDAWFLDVASPTWEDLRAIGKLLHIHPLTLEDILQQDPREKLELFTKLGYYFISFRAIETQSTKEKIRFELGVTELTGNKINLDEGSVGEGNIYLAIFKDGICCFHFTDVSEHTDRVRNRMVLLEQVVKTSDWIAHHILDSIVDSFFPFLEEIEKEVMAIDQIVYAENSDVVFPVGLPVELVKTSTKDLMSPRAASILQRTFSTTDKEGFASEKPKETFRLHFARPRFTFPLLFRRMKRRVFDMLDNFTANPSPNINATQLLLRRLARTRKHVSVMGHLLGTKSDVVTRIRKRLTRTEGLHKDSELDIYMGDVQDHILTLQHALAHYERMLGQSHPTYSSQLRTISEMTKGSSDKKLIYLTVVTIWAITSQTLTGMFSMNVNMPHNGREPGYPFNWFVAILTSVVIILFTITSIVRYWLRQGKCRGRQSF